MTDAELLRIARLWSQGNNTQQIAQLMSQGRETVPESVIYNVIGLARKQFPHGAAPIEFFGPRYSVARR